MKRFLSIDFDYLIDCDKATRDALFPTMDETIPKPIRKQIWKQAYLEHRTKLTQISILKEDYKNLLDICRRFSGLYRQHDSHQYIYNFIMDNTAPKEVFEVYNIDFHHDMYHLHTRNEKVNCGNWANVLKEDRPDMQYY